MLDCFHTKSTIKTRIIQGRRKMSKNEALTMATIETVGIQMVTMILKDWNRGTNSGWHYFPQRNKGKIAIGNGYIYTHCILYYDKHICIPTEVGNSVLGMQQYFISCCFYSYCSWFPTFLKMVVFTNTIEPRDVLTLNQYIRLWSMCSSGGIFHNPNLFVWFQYNGKYIYTPPLDIIYSFINKFLHEEYCFLT